MTNSQHDENGRPTIICASKIDGKTIIPALADPTSHVLKVEMGGTGADNGNNLGNAELDENNISVWTALSSDGSGEIIEVYANNLTNRILMEN
jgi:hypothetical protein